MTLLVDLNGSFLCPYQVVIDLNTQLSKPLASINADAFTPICELETVNDWINLESLGKPDAIKAQALCEKVSEPLISSRTVELDVATYEGVLTNDNLYCLLFLGQHLPSLSLCFYVKAEKEEALKEILTPLLENKTVVVNFKQSRVNNTLLLEQNRNQLLEKMGFACFKYPQNGPLSPTELSKCIGYAWVCLKSGAYDIGANALTWALESPGLPDAMHETLFMQLQLIRFLSHQYETVTQTQFPETFAFLKPDDVTSLHFIKAYSATLTRNLSVAATHFKQCHVDEHMALSDENSLYRLNLYALFLVLQKNEALALTLENRIQDYIKQHDIQVVGLKYVNFINTARLYKKSKQYQKSLSYYTKAYQEISGCGYAPSDHIYYNMNLGSLYEAAGDTEKALFFWVKTAIHWLSFNNKYALSWRPRLILCQEKITDTLKPLSIEKANQFLQEKIAHLLALSGMQRTASSSCDITFGAVNRSTQALDACYIANNMLLYGYCDTTTNKCPCELTALVAQVLKQTMVIEESHNRLSIDVQNEFYPISKAQAWTAAKIAGCRICYYDNEALFYDEAQTQACLEKTGLVLAPAITELQSIPSGLKLRYNRSFLTKTMEAVDEIHFIQWLERVKTVSFNQLDANNRETFARLLEKKVVMLIYPSATMDHLREAQAIQ